MEGAPVAPRGDPASNTGCSKTARWAAMFVPAMPFFLAGMVMFARGQTVMGAVMMVFGASVPPQLAIRWACDQWLGRLAESRNAANQDKDMPPLVFEPTTLGASAFDDVELAEELCSVCLRCLGESPDEGEAPRGGLEDVSCCGGWALPCGHKFHTGCLRVWLSKHRTCPLCRSPAHRVQAFALPRCRAADDAVLSGVGESAAAPRIPSMESPHTSVDYVINV